MGGREKEREGERKKGREKGREKEEGEGEGERRRGREGHILIITSTNQIQGHDVQSVSILNV